MRPARGAHIVIRGLGWKQREDRGSKMASGRSLYSRCFLACNYLPESHGWHTARSLVRCFASLCKRVLPLPHHVPGQPAGRSLARSLARSFIRSFTRPSTRSVVVSAPVFLDRVFGGVQSSTEKALGISLRAEP